MAVGAQQGGDLPVASVSPRRGVRRRSEVAEVGCTHRSGRRRCRLSLDATRFQYEPYITEKEHPITDQHPDLLTITEAAAIVRRPVATLRYWRHLGTGPRSFRLGRRVVYKVAALQEWIDGQSGDAE
jgi:Helix-turn-helix domain